MKGKSFKRRTADEPDWGSIRSPGVRVNKARLPEIAEPIFREIRKRYPAQYDAKQSIGKRYARVDEAGTPFCFTIDGQTHQDQTLTVRYRDDVRQERIAIDRVGDFLAERIGSSTRSPEVQ